MSCSLHADDVIACSRCLFAAVMRTVFLRACLRNISTSGLSAVRSCPPLVSCAFVSARVLCLACLLRRARRTPSRASHCDKNERSSILCAACIWRCACATHHPASDRQRSYCGIAAAALRWATFGRVRARRRGGRCSLLVASGAINRTAATDSMASLLASAPVSALSESVPPFHILLFYRYCPVTAPLDSVLEWQRALCAGLHLTGRIRLATEGINATLAGSEANIARYIAAMNSQGPPLPPAAEGGPAREGPPLFAGIEYKRSTSNQPPFESLGMFLVPELTASGKMGKSRPPGLQQPKQSTQDAAEGGQAAAEPAASASAASTDGPAASAVDPALRGSSSMHLTPAQWHEALSTADPETTLLLDTRNAYETAVGTFAGACDPKIRAFHQLPEFINQNLPAIRSKKRVLMFCTGGIRCEKASLYLAHRAPDTEVLQLEGGIHKYLDAFPDGGHFRGKNFVFDGRLAMGPEKPAVHGEAAVVGRCVHCASVCDHLSEQEVCTVCKSFLIFCEGCRALYADKRWAPLCPEHILLAAGEGAPEVEDPKHKHRVAKEKQAKNSPAAAAQPASASAAMAVASAPVASSACDSECGAADDSDSAASPSGVAAASLACLPQFHAFLSRFSLSQLSAQLREIDAVLAWFAHPSQKKSASRSRNRKANLFTQRRRIAGEIQRRVVMGEKSPEQEDVAAEAASPSAAVSSPPAAAPLLSFVPFLNV